MAKKVVTIQQWKSDNMEYPAVSGRLLGLLTRQDFEEVMALEGRQNKLFTVKGASLADVTARKDISGLRLAVALHKKDGKPVVGKHLYITEELGFVYKFKEGEDDCQITTDNQETYFYLSEEERAD